MFAISPILVCIFDISALCFPCTPLFFSAIEIVGSMSKAAAIKPIIVRFIVYSFSIKFTFNAY
jgi:hypothetical protein